MAEAWLNQICGKVFRAQSAGLEPGMLNPLAVQAMSEVEIDISSKKTQGISAVLKSGDIFNYVITVCDESSAEKCPIFPGSTRRLNWSFPDPARLTGSEAERLKQVRIIRDQIRARIEQFCEEVCGDVGAL